MKGVLRLYPPVKVIGKSFKGCKVITVPNQSMGLAEILQRFIRQESLPVSREGFYATGQGDLEKMAREDLSVLHERTTEFRERYHKALADKAAKDKAEADAKAEAAINARVEAEIASRGLVKPVVV